MSFSRLDNLLWAAGFVGNAGLLVILIVQKRWRLFPVFTFISGFELVQTITLFVLSRDAQPPTYFWAYWGFTAVDFFLQLLLLLEITRVSLRPKRKLVAISRLPVLLCVVAGVSLTAVVSMAASPPLADRWDIWELRASLFTSLLMCELCGLLSAYANRLGLQWRTHTLAITHGYTAWAAVSVVGDAMFAATGWHRELLPIFDLIRMVVYLAVLVYWGWSLSLNERKRAAPALELELAGASPKTNTRV